MCFSEAVDDENQIICNSRLSAQNSTTLRRTSGGTATTQPYGGQVRTVKDSSHFYSLLTDCQLLRAQHPELV